MLLSATVVGGLAQAPDVQEHHELSLKSSVPALESMSVTYSPDERYAAITGGGTIYVYNLYTLAETRRIPLDQLTFSAWGSVPVRFDSSSKNLVVAHYGTLLKCAVDVGTQCATIRNDVGINVSSFDIASDGRITYINSDNIPSIVDPNRPDIAIVLPQTVPELDKKDFSWDLQQLHILDSQRSVLVLSGSIDRTIKNVNNAGHTKTINRREWHTSIFNVENGQAVSSYVGTPIDADTSLILPNHHVLLCGPDQSEEEELEKKDITKQSPRRVYDAFDTRYLNARDLSVIPTAYRKTCLDGPEMHLQDFDDREQARKVAKLFQSRWTSPRGTFEISTVTNQDQSRIIYLKNSITKATSILAGSATTTSSVAFLPYLRVATRGMLTTHFYDFAQSTYQSFPADVRFNANARFFAYFAPVPSEKMWNLVIQSPTEQSIPNPGLRIATPPTWFGISEDASVATYLTSNGLFMFSKGISTRLNCVSSRARILGSQPKIDPSGSVMGAFCNRNSEDASQAGSDQYFVVWDLKTLGERARVPATKFSDTASFNWDGSTVLLCGPGEIRIANAATGDVVFDQRISQVGPGQNISQAEMSPDGKTVVLAINTFYPDPIGKVIWFDLLNRKATSEVETTRATKGLSLDAAGDLAVLKDDDIVDIYGNLNRKRVVQLISVGPRDWLAFSEEGMFDGSANALQWAGFRPTSDSTLLTADLLFNELYTPGLLSMIAAGTPPRLPSGIHLSTYLELPGIRQMLQSGDLAPELEGDYAALCVKRDLLFESLTKHSGLRGNKSTKCPRQILLSDKSNPQLLVKALAELADTQIRTPWDGIEMKEVGGTVHILSAAVSDYSQGHQPDIPTAVSSTERLEQAFAQHAAGDNVINWPRTNCSGPLENKTATKVAILGCLEKMAVSVQPNDMVIILLAGHGGTAGGGDLFRYYAYPGNAADPGDAITSADLVDALRRFSAKRIVVVLDACDSGAAVTSLQSVLFSKAAQANFIWKVSGSSSPDLTKQGVLLIAAASGLEATSSDAQKNLFLDRLVELLNNRLPQSEPWLSHRFAAEMRNSIASKGTSGQQIVIQPFAVAIGANFQIVK